MAGMWAREGLGQTVLFVYDRSGMLHARASRDAFARAFPAWVLAIVNPGRLAGVGNLPTPYIGEISHL